MIEYCDIYRNNSSGIDIYQASNPTIRSCRIYDGKWRGICIRGKAQGIIEDCNIYGNIYQGIYISNESNPTIRLCRIYDGKWRGICIKENSLGLIEYCDIYRNNSSGIDIDQASNPTIRSCRIYDNKSYGLRVNKNGQGRLEYSQMKGNTLAGVINKNKGDFDIVGCKIYPNKPPYFRIFLTLVNCFWIPINFVNPLIFAFLLFGTTWTIFHTFDGFEQRGIKKRFSIMNLLLTSELGILGGIMFVNGFNPSLFAILLTSGTIWITMLIYRFFR